MASVATVQPGTEGALPSKRLFTTEEYHQMAESGILAAQERVELIEGEIIDMPPIGTRHASAVRRLIALFAGKLGAQGLLDVQNPVVLEQRSEPQPDLTVLRPRSDFYAESAPRPEDVLLLVEVADSSLPYDREVKLPLYARSGIQELWIVDLEGQLIEVFCKPDKTGYRVKSLLRRGQSLSPAAFPELELSVEQILGPASS